MSHRRNWTVLCLPCMSDIGRVAEGIFTAEAMSFAEKFVSGVLAEFADAKVPCSGSEHTPWTKAIMKVLGQMGSQAGYEAYPWLLDYVWWSKKGGEETMILGVESELDKDVVGQIGQDFQKLPSFKCQRKLLVFSAGAEETRLMAESYLQNFTQHRVGEEYLLIGFTVSGPRCFLYRVPNDGKQENVRFAELLLRSAAR